MHPPRGDEGDRHVADLAGCDRETWARFAGLLDPHDPDTLRKFADGHDIENRMLTAIGRHRTDLVLGARVAFSIGFDGIEGRLVDDDYTPGPGEFIGHPDGVLDDMIIECKSTEFMVNRSAGFSRIVPTTAKELQHHYKIQAGAYALALGKKRAIVIIECRASGMTTAISFKPELYADEIKQRMRAVLDIGDDEPEPTLHESTFNKSGQSWLCKYCRFAGCEHNRRAVPEVQGRESIQL